MALLRWHCSSVPCPYGLSPRGPSNSFTIFTPHSATLLHTTHARNSSNSGLCFQDLAHSFIFRIQQVLCLPLLRERPGWIPTIPNLERICRRLQSTFDFQPRLFPLFPPKSFSALR